MDLIVFSTRRELREYISSMPDGLLDKLYTIDEFLSKLVIVPDRAFVDEGARRLYLYEAIKNIDIKKLGFNSNFISFISDSDFIFRLFEELSAEKISLDDLKETLTSLSLSDIYGDYQDHLEILKELYKNYAQILESHNLVDRVTIKDFTINHKLLDGVDNITIYIDGFPSRFELRLYQMLGDRVKLILNSSPYYSKVLERLNIEKYTNHKITYLPSKKRVLKVDELSNINKDSVEVAPFSQRVDQVAWILAKIDEFVNEGLNPDKIAIILPDEKFISYLRLFDKKRNFNFAMGLPFKESRYYITLSRLYDAITGKREYLSQRVFESDIYKEFLKINSFDQFLEFILNLDMSNRERELIESEAFIFKRYRPLLLSANRNDLLHSWLNRLESLSIDDIGGGRVTVMGVLESRGIEFDGVIIPDFNEGVIPHITQKDIFLNSVIRDACGMPTRRDKENLQKHYYYSLMRNSKKVAISYVKNEESSVSRFLKELNLDDSNELQSEVYKGIIAPKSAILPDIAQIYAKNIFTQKQLTPTRLKDILECKRRAYYKYLLAIKKDRDEVKSPLGTIIHKALEESIKIRDNLQSYEEYYNSVISSIYKNLETPLDRFSFGVEWEDKIKSFCKRDFDNIKYAKEIEVEKKYSVNFEGFKLSFIVDRVDILDNKIRLIDYKTGTRVSKNLKDDENDFQLLFYYLWAEENYPNYTIEVLYEAIYEERSVTIDIDSKKELLRRLIQESPKDETIEYPMCEDLKYCKYCDYRVACGRDN